ncbi:MAG: hypothetical protein RJQ00_07090 [Vicingaceae bacterium]
MKVLCANYAHFVDKRREQRKEFRGRMKVERSGKTEKREER